MAIWVKWYIRCVLNIHENLILLYIDFKIKKCIEHRGFKENPNLVEELKTQELNS